MNEIYTFTIPVFIKMLGGLKNTVTKVAEFSKEKNIDEAILLQDRLIPDMFPFARQVQIACDNAKGAASRLTGKEMPKFDDNEKTTAELHMRIDKTIEYLKTFSEADFKESAGVKVQLPYFPNKYMTGFDYAREYAIPNFLFHVTVAYTIARHNGVNLGKADYMNGLPLKDL